MKYVALNEEVLYTSEVITRVDWADIEYSINNFSTESYRLGCPSVVRRTGERP